MYIKNKHIIINHIKTNINKITKKNKTYET
jgi:hypothetical protein